MPAASALDRPYSAAIVAALYFLFALPGAAAADPLTARRAVPLSENLRAGDRIQGVRFLGQILLPGGDEVDDLRIGQLSGLAWDDDEGLLYALSDRGALFHLVPRFEKGTLTGAEFVAAFPVAPPDPSQRGKNDTEGMDIANGRNGRRGDAELTISFERHPMVGRYRPDGTLKHLAAMPPVLADAKAYRSSNKMLEATCLAPDGSTLTMPEMPLRDEPPAHPLVQTRIFAISGPTAGQSWVWHPATADSAIVSMDCHEAGHVLVLEREYHPLTGRLVSRLRRAALPPGGGTLSSPESLWTLDSAQGHAMDNYEGLAWHQGRRYFVISDDNDLPFQRSLLMYFEIVP